MDAQTQNSCNQDRRGVEASWECLQDSAAFPFDCGVHHAK